MHLRELLPVGMSLVWRTWAGLGYKVYESAEEGGGSGSGLTLEVSVNPLDPIDRSLVCGAKIKRMLEKMAEMEMTVLTEALKLLCCTEGDAPDCYHEFRKTNLANTQQKVSIRFTSHMNALREYTVLTKRPADFVLFTAGYFAVAKTSRTTRSIFSGKRLSRKCPTPPPVNLIDVKELVRKMIQHGEGKRKRRKYHVLVGDFRHWFHQLAAPTWMQRLFGLRFRDKTLSWRSMPMGWSWSPFFAQAAAWSFMAYRGEGESPLLDEEMFRGGRSLPRWVRTPQGGFATVYYDNFIIVTPDEQELDAWETRVRANEQRLHVVIKEGSMHRYSDAQVRDTGFEFLGIHFRLVGGRGGRPQPTAEPSSPMAEGGGGGIQVTPVKREEWLKDLHNIKRGSLRAAAGWIGRAIFAVVCSGDAMQRRASGQRLIEVARMIGKASQGQGWDEKSPPQLWLEATQAARKAIAEAKYLNEFTDTRLLRGPTRTWVVASDSSTNGYGWVGYELTPAGLEQIAAPWAWHGEEWTGKKKSWHIFLKELDAAVAAYAVARRAADDEEGTRGPTRIILVTDNSAAYYAMNNGFTTSEAGQEILNRARALEAGDDLLQVVSGDNPSDCHSRNSFGDYEARVKRLEECLALHRLGGRPLRTHRPHKGATGESGLRHGEAEDGDDAASEGTLGSDDEEAALEEEPLFPEDGKA